MIKTLFLQTNYACAVFSFAVSTQSEMFAECFVCRGLADCDRVARGEHATKQQPLLMKICHDWQKCQCLR